MYIVQYSGAERAEVAAGTGLLTGDGGGPALPVQQHAVTSWHPLFHFHPPTFPPTLLTFPADITLITTESPYKHAFYH